MTDDITGIILAGGAGQRVGGQDKGLLHWRGRPLIAHVSERLAPQVQRILISCNRNLDVYQRYGERTIPDQRSGFSGPLAGLEAVAPYVTTRFALVVTCDTPRLPPDLALRLLSPLRAQQGTAISYAHDGVRGHYLCAAVTRECLATVPEFLDSGNRKVRDWLASHPTAVIDFEDQSDAFRNFNSSAEFEARD